MPRAEVESRPEEAEPRRKRRRAQTQLADADGHSNDGDDDGPACQSCRKRKSRCSKQQPCEQCERLQVECTYDERRRPGFKSGVIESLSNRLANLEQMFLGQAFLLQTALAAAKPGGDPAPSATGSSQGSLLAQADHLRQRYLQAAAQPGATQETAVCPPPQSLPMDAGAASDSDSDSATNVPLPSDDDVDGLVAWYFENVHRWIPILHIRRFHAKLAIPAERSKVHIILLAITSLALRFRRPSGLCEEASMAMSTRYRHAVILRSMGCFSVESLQALVILAFDIVGSGRGPSTWSIIGSMARTVEHLRLNTEPALEVTTSNEGDEYLIRRMTFLKRAGTWVEEEERRRLFWSVFMIDRFCSVATGWNKSMPGTDVRRRLPCEGSIWDREIPVKTPFFGGWDDVQVSTPVSERTSSENGEVESVGGFAFCLEATDTLNLVTEFFLQRAFRFECSQQIRMWLLKFKELDLRLVKWRLSLPEKWREASVLNQDGIMDPNLTLAHITHNTAVIQLHQCIAFPLAPLQACLIALPSTSSAETCLSAAYEIGTIARQFLQQSNGITHPQLAFCLFIAGRVLVVHAANNPGELHTAFGTISSALQEISSRWDHCAGENASSKSTDNLASRLNRRLLHAQATMSSTTSAQGGRSTLDVGRPVYFDDGDRSRAVSECPTGHKDTLRESRQAPVAGAAPEHSFEALSDSSAEAIPSLPGLWGEDANLFANYDTGVDFFTTGREGNWEMGDWGGTKMDWVEGLEGVFDDEFQQMLRVSTYTEAGSQ